MLYNITMDWQVIFYIDKEDNEPVKDFILGQSDGAIAEILRFHANKCDTLSSARFLSSSEDWIDKSE